MGQSAKMKWDSQWRVRGDSQYREDQVWHSQWQVKYDSLLRAKWDSCLRVRGDMSV